MEGGTASEANGGTAGSSAGETGSGGRAGSGGTGTGGLPVNCGEGGVSIVDDMEDNNSQIADCGGRRGYWYTFGPTTAVIVPKPGIAFTMTEIPPSESGVTASQYVAKSSAVNLKGEMGEKLDRTKSPYDLRKYSAVRFVYRTVGLQPVVDEFRFRILTSLTTPVAEGGECPDDDSNCNDHYGCKLEASAEWTTEVVLLATSALVVGDKFLDQEHWGYEAAWQPDQALALQFIARTSDMKGVEIWVDQLEFLE
jgi:hypothetical protein